MGDFRICEEKLKDHNVQSISLSEVGKIWQVSALFDLFDSSMFYLCQVLWGKKYVEGKIKISNSWFCCLPSYNVLHFLGFN